MNKAIDVCKRIYLIAKNNRHHRCMRVRLNPSKNKELGYLFAFHLSVTVSVSSLIGLLNLRYHL